MTHLLVTNDYPPKVGGIQSYLWELWRRLPADEFAVFTTPYKGAAEFDAGEDYRIVRSRQRVLFPTMLVRHKIDSLVKEIDAKLVVFDPAVPVGVLGPDLKHKYAVVLHGAEVTVPGRLPVAKYVLARTISNASLIISASGWATSEAQLAATTMPPSVYVPPGVDVKRFKPLPAKDQTATRRRLGLPTDKNLILGLSRLVPRKGFDILIGAAARAAKQSDKPIEVVIAGKGRDLPRLRGLADAADVPVRFLGRVDDADVADLYASADVFAMLCRSRWAGLEQEGFGIVFLEAAAAGTPQVAGRSGGAAEAVEHGVSGLVVDHPTEEDDVAEALLELLNNPDRRAKMGKAGRERAVNEFCYDRLASRLYDALRQFDDADG